MLAHPPCYCSWYGNKQGLPDLFVYLDIYADSGRDDKYVSILCGASATQGRLVGLLGTDSTYGFLNSLADGIAYEELGCKCLHGLIPGKRLRLHH